MNQRMNILEVSVVHQGKEKGKNLFNKFKISFIYFVFYCILEDLQSNVNHQIKKLIQVKKKMEQFVQFVWIVGKCLESID